MPRSSPYQPLIFRLLHGIHGSLVLGSAVTGFWLYNTWDYRWGRVPLPDAETKWLDIHHHIGEVLTPLVLIFLFYSVFVGRRRLISLKSLKSFLSLSQSSGWRVLHRLINTGLLGLLILSMVSSRLMGGASTLLEGKWSDVWYNLHVLSWALIVLLFVAHVLLSAKVGGFALLQSMIALKVLPADHPNQWPKRFSRWVKRMLNG